MKVVIQSNCGPYGLSRRAIEAAAAVLPDHIIHQIDKLVVVSNAWGFEPFEYDPRGRVAYFSYAGDPTDRELRDRALRELLLGFARVDAGAEFRVRLSERQRATFNAFIDQWYSACTTAIAESERVRT
jgi:hypothetical protein